MTQDQGARFDPAVVVAQAADALAGWDAELARPSWDLVIVDDAQELTAAGVGLVRAIAEGGARIVLVGNADQAVQGYRGALPTALADAVAPAPRGLGAGLARLGPGHRQREALSAVTSAVVARIGTSGVGSARERGTWDLADGEVEVLTAAHRHAHSRAVADALRRARHGLDGPPTPWSEMVVIARSTARLRELRADLAAADIPCETLGDGAALHAEPAVAPLLTLMRRAAESARGGASPWEEHEVMALLGSRLVGLDPVALRRLRRALVKEERLGAGREAPRNCWSRPSRTPPAGLRWRPRTPGSRSAPPRRCARAPRPRGTARRPPSRGPCGTRSEWPRSGARRRSRDRPATTRTLMPLSR
ncbi:hypothetical protein GCM10025873_27600 [Demequina sediminis]|uniref:UvrD-helicase domain-containing protein n=1 Tax=Demequina sediminis TaxID=1930058 RepID=UPI0025746D36|nr:UvrD-helicase domain-containing protein [Demequina sediminis]BDZ62969.1 hypothetical protein GCM10025873_27600 [Demequina sediminis]